MNNIFYAKLTPAQCAVDLGDGSERGLYVNQDYVLAKLGRPHRAINLMYCYYPFEEKWPQRASEAYKDSGVSFAWDFPYDDYFPYQGGKEGNTLGEPFTFMRDVRRHGQDVILTLTCDPAVTDEQIIAIAKDLRPFGRMFLRLNHEATGDWFSFNKRASYQEVADFYVRFTGIIKEYAPNVSCIICIGGVEGPNEEISKEKEFTQTLVAADVWSVDKYLSLNWGWPYEVAEDDNDRHASYDNRAVFESLKKTVDRFTYLNGGKKKPMVVSEFNADGDVAGPARQASDVEEFAEMIKNEGKDWFSGFTMYQFRDDGRLGLEITDPNNSSVGIEQPVLGAYKKIIHDEYFRPGIEAKEGASLPAMLRWGGSEDAEGIALEIEFEKQPVFAEANFNGTLKEANLMMELNGRWFFKKSGVTFVDFMPAFFEKPLDEKCTLKLNIFAPPASGENDETQGEDWLTNYYYELKELPEIRIRYNSIK